MDEEFDQILLYDDLQSNIADPFEKLYNLFSTTPSIIVDDATTSFYPSLFASLNNYPSLIDDIQIPPITSPIEDGCLSQRLKWIKHVFRLSKGSRFGSQKRDIAFLLLSDCPLPSELSNLLEKEESLGKIMNRSRGLLPLRCQCPYKECMARVLGWEHKKSLNIIRAAELFGPAIAYCIPEKQSIVDFLRARQLAPVDCVLRVDLQDRLFNYLDIYVKSTQLNISAESLISFATGISIHQQFTITGASTLDDLAKQVFIKIDTPADQEYLFEIFDGRVANSHRSVSSFRCSHQIPTCCTFAQLKLFRGAEFKLIFFEASSVCKSSSLRVIVLSIVSVLELDDLYCILE